MQTIVLISIGLVIAATAFLFGLSAGSKQEPVKRTNEALSESFAEAFERADHYQAALICIRNRLAGQKSGTARSVVREIQDALK